MALDLAPGRRAYVQVAAGEVQLNGQGFVAGDRARVQDEARLEIAGLSREEVLVFRLALNHGHR